MFNKKIGLLVLACAAMGLVACGEKQEPAKTSTPAGDSEPAVSQQSSAPAGDEEKIPQVEGKIGIYFDFVDTATVTLEEFPDYMGIFITGAWNTSYFSAASDDPMTGAVEMQRLGETRTFYTYIPDDANLGDLGYQIALGYGKNSGLGVADQGIQWDYKTMYSSANFGGLDHPFMTKVNDHLYACLSDDEANPMGFKDILNPPVKLYDIKVSFTLDEAVVAGMQSNHEIAIKGAYDGWSTAKSVTANEAGVYTFEIANATDGIIAGDISMCIGIRNKVTMADTMDDKYNLALAQGTGEATGGYLEEEKDDAGVVTKYSLQNIVISLITIYGDHYTYNLGKLVLPEHANGGLDAYEFPSNALPAMEKDITINLTHTGEAALENATVAIAGTINNWSHTAMTEVEAGRAWSYTLSKEGLFAANEIKFKFTNGDWDWEVAPNAEMGMGNDFVVTLELGKYIINVAADMTGWGAANAGDAKYLKASAFAYVAAAMDQDVVITVTHNGENAAVAPYIAGSVNNWSHEAMVKQGNEDVYTYVVDTEGKYEGDEIQFLITPGNWDSNKICAAGGENIKVALKAGYNAINIVADLSVLGGADYAVYASLEYVQVLVA